MVLASSTAAGSLGSALSTVAWVILFGGGILYVVAVPALRERAAARLRNARDYFVGPPVPESDIDTDPDGARDDVPGPGASRRDADLSRLIDTFDLSIFDES